MLLLTIHHIVDRRLVDRRAAPRAGGALRAPSRGRPSPLPALPVQYADYARLAARVARAARRWRRSSPTGAGGSPARRRCSSCRPTGRGRRCDAPRRARRGCGLPPALAGALARLGRREGATLFMILLAAFAALLAR